MFLFPGHTTTCLGFRSITKEVTFELFTKDNTEKPIILTVDSILSDNIKKDIPWKFLIHGWTTSPSTSPWFNIHKTNYFQKGDYNVVFVDWSKPAGQSYVNSVINARGKYVSNIVRRSQFFQHYLKIRPDLLYSCIWTDRR